MASYEQRGKKKLWSVRFQEENPDGTTSHVRLSEIDGVPFKTKKEAQAGYHTYLNRKQEEERRREEQKDPANMKFNDLLELYLKHMATRSKESTVYDARKKFDVRIVPFFEPYRVCDVTPVVLLNYLDSLSDCAFSYKKKLFNYVCSILSHGERYYNTPNASKVVEKPRNTEPRKEMQVWTPEEFLQVYPHFPDQCRKAFFHLLYESGCRKGEAEALLWSDFDFTRRTVRIDKSITRKVPNAPYAVTSTKNTSSDRTVTLTPELCRELALWYEVQKKGGAVPYAFGDQHPPTTQYLARGFEKAIKESGVKRIRIHDLRHSCASLLISKGVSIVAVSRRLGHSSVEQTLNRYSHMMPDDVKLSLDSFSEIGALLENA